MSKFVSIQAGNHRYRIAIDAITKYELDQDGSIRLSATHGREAEAYRVPPELARDFVRAVDPEFAGWARPATDNPDIPPAIEAT